MSVSRKALCPFKAPGPLRTPVLLLVYNRLLTTSRVFQVLKQVKPPRLYVASDGPKRGNKEDEDKVRELREHIRATVDWDCELYTLFRDRNLGCRDAVSGAIDWFFETEESGIIIEDDCLPSQSFFWYCEQLLNIYEDDNRIYMISGYNKQNYWRNNNVDYFFSNLGGIWGWATWRRAWQKVDMQMNGVDAFMSADSFEHLLGPKSGRMRRRMFVEVIKRRVDTWDFAWAFARHKNGGICCVPSKSLIENIGFGVDATHTQRCKRDTVVRNEIELPVQENCTVVPDRHYDDAFMKALWRDIGLFRRLSMSINAIRRDWEK